MPTPFAFLAAFIALTLIPVLALSGEARDKKILKPSAKDKCPVCGMFVAKYPDWVAGILLKDGSAVFFDGAKDLFKYSFDPGKYQRAKKTDDIDKVWVTDYYDLAPIDGREAYYVIGSDVYGPMGRELIPFASAQAAEEFLKDHKGKSILRFREVTPALLKTLD